MKNIIRRGRYIDFYFTESLGDWPWNKETRSWFRKTLEESFPEEYRSYRLGDIYSRGVRLNKLITADLKNDGEPIMTPYQTKDPKSKSAPLVIRAGEQNYPMGLSGRNIALWQSHGRYFDQNSRQWKW